MNRLLKSIFFTGVVFITLGFLLNNQVHAQLDPTFGTNGVAMADSGQGDVPLASFVLPDGKMFIVSRAGGYPYPDTLAFIRFNADGTLDSTYGTNGVLQIAVPYSIPNAGEIKGAARQPDGKIVLVGQEDYDGDGKFDIAVWRPSNGGWYIYYPDINQMSNYTWGTPTDFPLPAKF